jgi:hypothetical protein
VSLACPLAAASSPVRRQEVIESPAKRPGISGWWLAWLTRVNYAYSMADWFEKKLPAHAGRAG